MQGVDELVAVAHRRLALRRLLIAIERHPQFLDEEDNLMALTIKKPIELAGLGTHLIRVEAAEAAIKKLHTRYDAVVPAIEELVAAHTVHVGDLETYEGKLRSKIEAMIGSNGGEGEENPTGQAGQQSDGQGNGSSAGQIISSETKA